VRAGRAGPFELPLEGPGVGERFTQAGHGALGVRSGARRGVEGQPPGRRVAHGVIMTWDIDARDQEWGSGGLASWTSCSASCGNQDPAAASSTPHSGSNRFCAAAVVGQPGWV